MTTKANGGWTKGIWGGVKRLTHGGYQVSEVDGTMGETPRPVWYSYDGETDRIREPGWQTRPGHVWLRGGRGRPVEFLMAPSDEVSPREGPWDVPEIDVWFMGKRSNPPDINQQYKMFHHVEPERVTTELLEVPTMWVAMGAGVDVSYGIRDSRSKKSGAYVHDFDDGVVVYRAAKRGEKVDLRVQIPSDIWSLGEHLGFTYVDPAGHTHEVEPEPLATRLCWVESIKALLVVDTEQAPYLIKGGQMTVTDWIRK